MSALPPKADITDVARHVPLANLQFMLDTGGGAAQICWRISSQNLSAKLSSSARLRFCIGWGTKMTAPLKPMARRCVSKASMNSSVSTLTPERLRSSSV